MKTHSCPTHASLPLFARRLLRVAVMSLLWQSRGGGGGRADAFAGRIVHFTSSSSSPSLPRGGTTRNQRMTFAIPTQALHEGLSPSDYFGDPATIAASSSSVTQLPSHENPERLAATTKAEIVDAAAPRDPVTPESKHRKGKVQRLQTLAEFIEFIDSAPTHSLVVIKFFGHTCPLCRKIEMKYKKMAHYYSPAPIQFAEIESKVHPELFRTLGIDTFPHIQIYRNGQCVASHGTERDTTFEPMVKDTIDRELCMTLDDWDAFLTAFAAPIQASTDQLNQLRTMLHSSSTVPSSSA